jgi:hypothetical protein
MNKLQKFISVSMMAVSLLSFAPAVLAANVTPDELLPTNIGTTIGTGTSDVRTTVANIIRVAMGLLGIVAVVIILIGGFTWMTAGGNDEKVGEAKKWIFSGVIGLAIVLSAYAIASFVISSLITATTSAPAAI